MWGGACVLGRNISMTWSILFLIMTLDFFCTVREHRSGAGPFLPAPRGVGWRNAASPPEAHTGPALRRRTFRQPKPQHGVADTPTFLFLGMGSSKSRLLASASSMPSSGCGCGAGLRTGLKLSADSGGDGVDGLDWSLGALQLQ